MCLIVECCIKPKACYKKLYMMLPNGYLIYEDESFFDSTVAKMNALRKNGQFCDVRLQVCGYELRAHRAILACCSPYLFELFSSGVDPHGVAHVTFDDQDPEAMEILLNYAYTAQLKADKEQVKHVYSAAKKLKMERVKQICGDYLLLNMDCQSAISCRNFASHMADVHLLDKIDGYIQENLLQISYQEDFLKLPRLKLEVILEDNQSLPNNGKLYSKVICWLQRCLWENGEELEKLMEEVQTLYYSTDYKQFDWNTSETQTEVIGNDDHIYFVQRKPVRETDHWQMGPSSPRSLLPSSITHLKNEWKCIASEKTTNSTYLCLAVLNGVLSVVFLHGRGSPQGSPASTPCLPKSMSFEAQPEELEEKLLSPMRYARSGLGVAVLDGKLVAAGGYNREECLRTVECYDPLKDNWTFVAAMRTPRARFQMAVLMGQLYVMGGSNGQSDELSCGETYDPIADEWTQVPELKINRCNSGVCALNNKLYVIGGSDPSGQKGLKNCNAFDPLSKTWNNCAPLNIRRHHASVCVLDSCMYVIGGAESWNCLRSVECYNSENNTWTLTSPMNVARRGAGVVAYEGKLFVVGGFNGSRALRCVEVYDPAKNEWRMLGSMTSARSNAGVVVLGGTIYAVGGFDGNNFLSSMETYDLQANEWSPCADAFVDV